MLFFEDLVDMVFGFLGMGDIECLYFACSSVVSFGEEGDVAIVEERKESVSVAGTDRFDFFAFYGHIGSSSDA